MHTENVEYLCVILALARFLALMLLFFPFQIAVVNNVMKVSSRYVQGYVRI